MMNSKRKYLIVVVYRGDNDVFNEVRSLDRIVNGSDEGYEYLHALNDVIDDILDLKDGDMMRFFPDRNSGKDELGIIKRIQ